MNSYIFVDVGDVFFVLGLMALGYVAWALWREFDGRYEVRRRDREGR